MTIDLKAYDNKYVNIILDGASAGVGKLIKIEEKWWLKEAELLVNPGVYLVT